MKHEVITRLTRAIELIYHSTALTGNDGLQEALECVTCAKIELESRKGKNPTLDEVRLLAAKAALPDIEAEKFYHYFESNGWRVGKNPMRSIGGALGTWRLNWQQRTCQAVPLQLPFQPKVLTRYQIEKEVERLEKHIAKLRDDSENYPGWKDQHGFWRRETGKPMNPEPLAKLRKMISDKKALNEQFYGAPQ